MRMAGLRHWLPHRFWQAEPGQASPEGSGGRLDVWTPAKSSRIDNVLPSLSGSTLRHFLAHSSQCFELISIKPASSAT